MKEKTIFDHLNNLFYKNGLPFDKKICKMYLISLWLSHDERLLPILQKINPFHFSIDDEIIYQYYYEKIPKGKRFIRWVKKEGSDTKDDDIRQELNLSKMEYLRYKQLIEKSNNKGKRK